jgi:hypothetical protein
MAQKRAINVKNVLKIANSQVLVLKIFIFIEKYEVLRFCNFFFRPILLELQIEHPLMCIDIAYRLLETVIQLSTYFGEKDRI